MPPQTTGRGKHEAHGIVAAATPRVDALVIGSARSCAGGLPTTRDGPATRGASPPPAPAAPFEHRALALSAELRALTLLLLLELALAAPLLQEGFDLLLQLRRVLKAHAHDLNATLLFLLGFDHERLTFRHEGRDYRLVDVHGTVVRALLS